MLPLSAETALHEVRIFIPLFLRLRRKNALMSLSIVGAILSACSITDALHPSAFRYSAASSPDAPPPIIAALFGIVSRLYTSLTSVISAPEISSFFGFEPVQMSRFFEYISFSPAAVMNSPAALPFI